MIIYFKRNKIIRTNQQLSPVQKMLLGGQVGQGQSFPTRSGHQSPEGRKSPTKQRTWLLLISGTKPITAEENIVKAPTQMSPCSSSQSSISSPKTLDPGRHRPLLLCFVEPSGQMCFSAASDKVKMN